MLAVTDAAANTIAGMTNRNGLPEEGGLRVAVRTQGESERSFTISLASAPADGDEVVTAATGAHVFLDHRAAEYLSDKVLDVRAADGGELNFVLLQHPA